LVVNLDGTLLKSDCSFEALFQLLATDVRAVAKVPLWLTSGRGRLESEVAERVKINPELLPYDPAVLEYLRDKRACGRRLVLVSAADQRYVDQIAQHLGIFENAHGSTPGRTLAGPERCKFLVERYGEGGFDYAGNGSADRAIMEQARRVVTAGAAGPVRESMDSSFANAEHVSPQREGTWERVKRYLSAMRPEQWVKNLLVFVPLVAVHEFNLVEDISAVAAFAAFCLTASAVYILNDLLDLPYDRQHPRKRARPFASGRVPVLHGVLMFFALLAGALAISLSLLNVPFIAALTVYFVATLLYSLKLKRILTIDMITLAGLYTIRVIAGAVATGIELSEWLLALSMFIFLALAAVKRQSELIDLVKRERKGAPGRRYVVGDLPIIQNFGIAAGYISVLVLALYINTPEVELLYKRPIVLWGACPPLLYWISRMFMKAHRGEIHDDPIVFAFHDRVSLWTGAAVALVIVGAATTWV
jgi:4-hydroxybenzoate polyprenyltransferase